MDAVAARGAWDGQGAPQVRVYPAVARRRGAVERHLGWQERKNARQLGARHSESAQHAALWARGAAGMVERTAKPGAARTRCAACPQVRVGGHAQARLGCGARPLLRLQGAGLARSLAPVTFPIQSVYPAVMYHGTSSEAALYACSKVASKRVWLFCDCAPAACRGVARQTEDGAVHAGATALARAADGARSPTGRPAGSLVGPNAPAGPWRRDCDAARRRTRQSLRQEVAARGHHKPGVLLSSDASQRRRSCQLPRCGERQLRLAAPVGQRREHEVLNNAKTHRLRASQRGGDA